MLESRIRGIIKEHMGSSPKKVIQFKVHEMGNRCQPPSLLIIIDLEPKYEWDGGVLDTGILLADLTPDETKEYNELVKRGYINY